MSAFPWAGVVPTGWGGKAAGIMDLTPTRAKPGCAVPTSLTEHPSFPEEEGSGKLRKNGRGFETPTLRAQHYLVVP